MNARKVLALDWMEGTEISPPAIPFSSRLVGKTDAAEGHAPRIRHERTDWLTREILPHERALRNAIRRWGPFNNLEPEDVIQEAYAKLVSLPSVAEIRNPKSYLFQICRNIMLEHLRRRRVVSIEAIADLVAFEPVSDIPDPESACAYSQMIECLNFAITGLNDPHKTVFRLRINEGYSFSTIGAMLQVSDNAAQKLFARALKAVASSLHNGKGTETSLGAERAMISGE